MSIYIREEVLQIEGFISLISHIKYEITAYMTCQNEIFFKFENDSLEKCGFLKRLKSYRVDGEKSILRAVLENSSDIVKIDRVVLQLLNDFSDSLGKISSEMQVEKCDLYIDKISEICRKKSEMSKGEMKLCRSMGLLLGVMTVLILL